MPPYRKRLEVDSGRIFRWSFFVVFLVLQLPRPGADPATAGAEAGGPPGDRDAGGQGGARAVFVAGAITLSANVAVWLILAPRSWTRGSGRGSIHRRGCSTCRPANRPPGQHAGSVEIRRTVAAALVLTGRRIWFLPAAWGPEPWSIARKELERVEAEPPAFARFLPVCGTGRTCCVLRRPGIMPPSPVADPDAVLAWFARPDHPMPSLGPRARPQGVFDA